MANPEGHIYDAAGYLCYALSAEEIASAFSAEEKKARELFKCLQPEVYEAYKASGFKYIDFPSSIFPIVYRTHYRGIGVYDNAFFHIGGVCIYPGRHYSENPDTDNILTLYLMLKWDEASVLRVGNWISLTQQLKKAWWVLCLKYKQNALRYCALRLRQKVLAVLSSCTSRKQ